MIQYKAVYMRSSIDTFILFEFKYYFFRFFLDLFWDFIDFHRYSCTQFYFRIFWWCLFEKTKPVKFCFINLLNLNYWRNMPYTDTLYRLPDELIKLFRSYEQIKKKEINAKWSIVFNETCLRENLWPNFTNLLTVCITVTCK